MFVSLRKVRGRESQIPLERAWVFAGAVYWRSAVCGGVKVRCERTGIANSLGAEIPFERDGRGSQISMARE